MLKSNTGADRPRFRTIVSKDEQKRRFSANMKLKDPQPSEWSAKAELKVTPSISLVPQVSSAAQEAAWCHSQGPANGFALT